MKKTKLLTVSILLNISLFAISWQPYCPDSIHAINICFGLGSSQGLICSPDGLYIYEDDMEWHHYSYGGMPVVEAVWFSPEKILVALSDGSWSDGIYTFDLQTHQFDVQEWLPFIKFLKLNPFGIISTYYAGSSNNGLLSSVDGENWYNVPYFDTIPCNSMDYYNEYMVVCEGNYQNNNAHLTTDGGGTWFASANGDSFSKVKFNYQGELFAIFPGASNSSGLYKSYNFGLNWEVVNWELFMSCVGYDAWGNVFAGWDNGEGIAMLNPDVQYPPFVYLNEGLPDTHVNEITMNPYMSAIVIFVCTNSGVYSSIDYMVGQSKQMFSREDIKLYPNPAITGTDVKIRLSGVSYGVNIYIYDAKGQLINSISSGSHVEEVLLPTSQLSNGIYYIKIETDNLIVSKQLLIH
ncbi:MAG: T9SS type A sorting domain-containing protein [Bacteroidales bacterium]